MAGTSIAECSASAPAAATKTAPLESASQLGVPEKKKAATSTSLSSPLWTRVRVLIPFAVMLGVFCSSPWLLRGFKELGAPVYEAIENTLVAKVCLFLALISTPEPSLPVLVLGYLGAFEFLAEDGAFRAWWRDFVTSGVEVWQIYVIYAPALFALVYWVNGLLLLALEVRFCPELLQSFKIQQTKRFDVNKFGKVAGNVALNTFVVLPLYGVGLYYHVHRQGFPIDFSPELPGPLGCALHILGYVAVNEVLFYYGHWLFHANTLLYRRIHKVHHEFTSPCALTAIYCHPLEFVVLDLIPLGLGVHLLGSHGYTFMLWIVFAVLGTQTHHCGYRWPWIPTHAHQPNFHDRHHETFSCNYGAMRILDWLHGTRYEDMFAAQREQTPKKAR